MKETTLSLSDDLVARLSELSTVEKQKVNELIEETLQPAGGDQTIMALTLLDKGFEISLVAKLTRLEESFLRDLQLGLKPSGH